jgi:putative nucleotidyltransferase with HDIG domain
MDDLTVQQFRAEVMARKNLPTIPTVLARILSLADGEHASGRQMVDVIEHDQALTAKLLRLANSAFFGQSRKVATIPRAVVLLGFSTVRNLALGVKVWETLGAGVSRARQEELWAHAVAVAVATKALATRLRIASPDEAFTAGLLHDVGRLIMAMKLREQYWVTVGGATESQAVDALESAAFGIDHAQVGSWLLEAWNLPAALVDVVRDHHAALSRGGLAGLLAVTDRLIAWTDVATGALRPEGEQLLLVTADRGITPMLWAQVTGQLRDRDDTAALGGLEG